MKLRLAAGLELPIDVVTQKNAFLGRTGSGKTYGATKLAELLLEQDAQVVALDPVGVWYGLRIGGDGKRGFRIPVFGGLHGDIPLQDTAGAMIADLIVDRGISAILDVSQFETDTAKARFASAFAERFFFRKKAAPAPVHLFLEECQEFVPQNPQGGDAQMLHAFTRMAKLGRNFGIGISLISQRPQEINKKVLNMTEVMFAFQMRGPQERKTIREWSSDKDLSIDIESELPSLAVGEAFVSSPQWLQVEKKVKIAKKTTADVSSTPKVGEASRATRPLTPIDLEELQAKMAAAIEQAKAEDPKELRKRIRELEAELRKGNAPIHPKGAFDQGPVDRAVAKAVADERRRQDRQRRILKTTVEQAISRIRRGEGELRAASDLLGGAVVEIDQNWMPAPSAAKAPAVSRASSAAAVDRAADPPPAPVRPAHAVRPAVDVGANGSISGGEQRILDALRELEEIGVPQATRPQAGAMARYDLTGGTGSKHVARLVENGYVSLPSTGKLQLTDAGRAIAAEPPPMLDDAALQARAMEYLEPGQARILRALIERYPDATSRAELGAEVQYDLTGGTGSKHVAKLVRLGFAEIPSTGRIAASRLLFPSRR